MKYFIPSHKDSTIYSDYQLQNTGIDQILNLFKIKSDVLHLNSRLLIEFDINDISQSISNGDIVNPVFNLEMKTTELKEIAYEFDLDIHPISSSWEMGLGKRQDSPKTTNGVSWTYRDFLGGMVWNQSGSDYISNISSSFEFNTKSDDLVVDVTDIVMDWVTGVYDNNGFIVKFKDENELNDVNYGEINFFSSETNTIYKPKLSVAWDDSSYDATNLTEVDDENLFCTISNLKRTYNVGNKYRFRIKTRPEYLEPTFSDASPYSIQYKLPPTSYYSVIDNVTKDVILPFSDYTKISADSRGSYFSIDFQGWEPERFYRILIKVEDVDGNIQYIDKGYTFNLVE